MDQDSFISLAKAVQALYGNASEGAMLAAGPILLVGAMGGLFLTRWIFRGGLSRARYRLRF